MDYRPRPTPCAHCGDTVLVVTRPELKLWGLRVGRAAVDRLEHADPSPDGEVYDGVDEQCRRARVVG